MLAHPIRLGFRDPADEEAFIGEMRDAGLRGIEVYHSDHTPKDMERYCRHRPEVQSGGTGGSDFHGDAKPQIALGTGWDHNICIPKAVLDQLRARA